LPENHGCPNLFLPNHWTPTSSPPCSTSSPWRGSSVSTLGCGLPEGLSLETAEADVESQDEADAAMKRVVTAEYPNHVWHVYLTTEPTVGFWVPWLPLALPQVWPFCWWVAVVIDHFSRRVIGVAVFKRPPTFQPMAAFLRRTIRKTYAKPRYIISDKGPQFWPARRSLGEGGCSVASRSGADAVASVHDSGPSASTAASPSSSGSSGR